MRKFILTGVTLAILGAGSSLATAQPMRNDPGASETASGRTMITDVQYRPYYGYHRYDRGPDIGAGIIGLAAGAIIGGAIANSRQPAYYEGAPGPVGDAVSYCMQRFRSYDRESGTYLGYDGMRHPCP